MQRSNHAKTRDGFFREGIHGSQNQDEWPVAYIFGLQALFSCDIEVDECTSGLRRRKNPDNIRRANMQSVRDIERDLTCETKISFSGSLQK